MIIAVVFSKIVRKAECTFGCGVSTSESFSRIQKAALLRPLSHVFNTNSYTLRRRTVCQRTPTFELHFWPPFFSPLFPQGRGTWHDFMSRSLFMSLSKSDTRSNESILSEIVIVNYRLNSKNNTTCISINLEITKIA